jgi:hypothetical protein
VADEKTNHDDRPRCGQPRSQNKGPCVSTILAKNGRCRAHGGNTGAPKGNKNALTTGRYETLFASALDDDEIELMGLSVQKSEIAHLEEEIALATVRELRMLKRIAALKTAPGGMTLVEENTETIAPDESAEEGDRPFSDKWASENDIDDPETERAAKAENPGSDLLKVKQKRLGTLGQIHAIESDLTAVQALKSKQLKHLAELKNPKLGPGNEAPRGEAAACGLDDTKRAEGIAALLDAVRARTARQLPGADPV